MAPSSSDYTYPTDANGDGPTWPMTLLGVLVGVVSFICIVLLCFAARDQINKRGSGFGFGFSCCRRRKEKESHKAKQLKLDAYANTATSEKVAYWMKVNNHNHNHNGGGYGMESSRSSFEDIDIEKAAARSQFDAERLYTQPLHPKSTSSSKPKSKSHSKHGSKSKATPTLAPIVTNPREFARVYDPYTSQSYQTYLSR